MVVCLGFFLENPSNRGYRLKKRNHTKCKFKSGRFPLALDKSQSKMIGSTLSLAQSESTRNVFFPVYLLTFWFSLLGLFLVEVPKG